MAQTCPTCRGEGRIIKESCSKCGGRGAVKHVREIEVSFPRGLDSDAQMRVRNEGEVGPGGAGDLYLFIRIHEQERYRRSGRDLEMDIPVSFVKATLGADIDVQTLHGSVTMKLPPGTDGGKVFRLRGKGMPDLRADNEFGDLYVKVMIDVPKKLSGEQRRLLEEFAKASNEGVNSTTTIKDKIKKVFK
jgi:molecular chaperone DnaJ